jgi:transposase-like protein
VKNMGGETTEAWRAVLDDFVKRGLRKPELLIVDGGAGLEAAPQRVDERAMCRRGCGCGTRCGGRHGKRGPIALC